MNVNVMMQYVTYGLALIGGAGVPGIDYCAGDQRAPGT